MAGAPLQPGRSDRAAAGPAGGSIMTVSAVTALVKDAIAEHMPSSLRVVGQVSNFKRHSSGHLYLTLKDDTCELSCVMWRSSAARLSFKPVDGLEVIAAGYVDVFERAGRYQLYIRKLEPRGVGALELAFRQLREKLAAQGLFAPEHRKPLPEYPQRIAVVTSPTGAAIRDIVQTLGRRYPCAAVLVYPVKVQGEGAADQIAAAIADLNRRSAALGGVDVVIVGRGGGSLEDLWAFNEEVVARAIYASRLPIISAVGHEVDVTISDLVADVRAATPTAAAELAVPDVAEVLAVVERHRASLTRVAGHLVEIRGLALSHALRRRALSEPLMLVQRREQAIDETCAGMQRTILGRLQEAHRRLRICEEQVRRIQPQAYLLHLERALAGRWDRLRRVMTRRLAQGERHCVSAERSLRAVDPIHSVVRLNDRLARADQGLRTVLRHRVARLRDRLDAEQGRLSALSYRSTLRRGFSITRSKKGRRVIRDLSAVADGLRVVTEIADGEFESEVVKRQQLELFE